MGLTLCTVIKRDNKYIDEWISYHMNIGIKDFIIYDNNNGIEDYPMTEFVSSLVKSKNIRIINKRNIQINENEVFEEAYNSCKNKWICLLHTYEFLSIKTPKIDETLDEFKKCSNIKLFINVFNDNNIIEHNGDFSINKFKNKVPVKPNDFNSTIAIIKTGISKYYKLDKTGIIYPECVTMSSDKKEISSSITYIYSLSDYLITVNSYPTKSLEEFLEKNVSNNDIYSDDFLNNIKRTYYSINKHTIEKDQFIEYYINKTFFANETNNGIHSYASFNFGNG